VALAKGPHLAENSLPWNVTMTSVPTRSMSRHADPVRALYSFPHKLGADRICYTAWQQVNGLASAGARQEAAFRYLIRYSHPSCQAKSF